MTSCVDEHKGSSFTRSDMEKITEYENRYQLRKKNPALYEHSRRAGVLDKFLPIEHKGLNRIQVIEKAKSYYTKQNLKEQDPELYEFCYRHGLIYSTFLHQYENIKSASDGQLLKIAKAYKNRTQCREQDRFIEAELRKRGLINKAFPLIKYSVQTCFEIAVKFNCRKDLWREYRGVYDWLSKKTWASIDEQERQYILTKMRIEPPADQERLLVVAIPELQGNLRVFEFDMETATKFAKEFKTRTDLRLAPNGGRSCYDFLNKHKKLDELFPDQLVRISHLKKLLSEL